MFGGNQTELYGGLPGAGKRRPPTNVAGLVLLGSRMNPLTAVMLWLLIPAHIALGFAWTVWASASAKFQTPSVRKTLLFSGLIACSLNITIYWLHVVWLNIHTDPSSWKLRDEVEEVCNFLIGYAILAGVVGAGRGRLLLVIAAMAGWGIWITGHIGIL
jgi:hypothetical protein